MKIRKAHILGMIFAAVIVLFDFVFFFNENIFYFLIGIAIVVISLPFIVGLVLENTRQKEINERFLEFSRNLAEGVKTGTPIGKSILNMRNKNYGSFTPHIRKLANQISLGIPINKAFETFAQDIGSDTIKRAVTLIREAEMAGGQIDEILDSVANSIYQIEKLKKERRAAISNLVVQGYIIFFIFIGIMLVMQFNILPLTAGIGGVGTATQFDFTQEPTATGETSELDVDALASPFLYLLLIQGLFTGLTIGKLSEGNIKAGIKHSFVLFITAFLVSSGAKAFL